MTNINLDLTGCESVCAEARRMIRDGADPDATLYAWRGTTLCLHPMPLSHWAGLTVAESVYQSAAFRKYSPMPDGIRRQSKTAARHTANSASPVGGCSAATTWASCEGHCDDLG